MSARTRSLRSLECEILPRFSQPYCKLGHPIDGPKHSCEEVTQDGAFGDVVKAPRACENPNEDVPQT